mmetsp:Transcript_65807/g.106105  ORF Transcript_65807/g.106105 Transcript_65807/m.106105 type:complete len:322 (-) Transcript_65807:743-1708(-)
MNNAILGEGAGPHEVVDRLILVRKPGLPIIGHDTLAGRGTHRGAQVDVLPLAELALATVRLIARNHVVTRLELGHTFTYTLHDGGSLVTKDAGEEPLRIMAVQRVCICMAKRHSYVLYPNLTPLRWCHLDLNHLQGFLRLKGHGGQALNLFPCCVEHVLVFRIRENRISWQLIWAPPQDTREVRGMILEVVLNEAGDEEVGVVVTRLHAQSQSDALLVASRLECLRLQLWGQEVVCRALVHQETDWRPSVILHQLHGVIVLPGFPVLTKVKTEGFLPPGHFARISDGREGRHGAVDPRVLQRNRQSPVAAHAVTHNPKLVG